MTDQQYPSPLAEEGGDPRSGEGEGEAAGIPLTPPVAVQRVPPSPAEGRGK